MRATKSRTSVSWERRVWEFPGGGPTLCRSISELLFTGRRSRNSSRLQICGQFLKIVDVRIFQFIKSGFVFPFRQVFVAILREDHFFYALAAVGSYGQVHLSCGESSLGELACGEIANFVDKRGYGAWFHLCAIGPPVAATAREEIALGSIVKLDFVRVGKAEIKKFLVLEVV